MKNEKNISRLKKESVGHVSVELKDFNQEMPLHWHSFYELELILDGIGVHVLNGKEYTVKRGAAYLLTPTDFHTVKAIEPMRLWHISFDEGILSEQKICEMSSGYVKKSFTLDEKNLHRLSVLAELLVEESEMANGCTKELCETILTLLLRDGDESRTGKHSEISAIRSAILYMNMHFREAPTLKTIAGQAGLHPNYFSELFKEVTGENYTARLTSLKLGYAKTLLSKGFSVSDACYNSGFGSISNFLTAFKKNEGMTPLEYKKSHGIHKTKKGTDC